MRVWPITEWLVIGGRIDGWDWKKLREEYGVQACLNLRHTPDLHHYPDVPKMTLHLPTHDRPGHPLVWQLQVCVDFIRQAIARGMPVYVHCRQGVHRAPTVAAAYLVATGQNPAIAITNVKLARPKFKGEQKAELLAEFATAWSEGVS